MNLHSVFLKSSLGVLQPHQVPGYHGQAFRHRGPSYQRRQERRQAARVAAGTAEQVGPDAVEAMASPAAPAVPAARAGEVCEDVGTAEQAISNTNSESESKIDTTEKAVKAF